MFECNFVTIGVWIDFKIGGEWEDTLFWKETFKAGTKGYFHLGEVCSIGGAV